MRKSTYLFTLLLTVCVLFSCKKKDNDPSAAKLNFGRSIYVMKASAPLEIELKASVAPGSRLVVPAVISGSAVLGEDYELPVKEFVFEAGQTSAKITAIPKSNLNPGREIKIELPAVSGYGTGDKKQTIIIIEPKEKIMYSFSRSTGSLLGKMNVTVELKGEISGIDFRASKDIEIPFSILAKSTAIPGKNFNIEGNVKSIKIKAGERRGSIVLDFLALGADGSKKAYLELGVPTVEPELYYVGAFKTFSCNVTQLKFQDLLGKWKPVGITNGDVFPLIFEASEYINSLPDKNDLSDVIEFIEDGNTNKIIPHLKGSLKNFFSGPEHSIVFDHIERDFEDYSTFTTFDIPYFMVNGVNTLFSASKIKTGNVFIGLEKLDDDNMLIYFHEYIPTDFFAKFYKAEGWPRPDYTPYYGITYKFTRVKE
ncbi:hypothetical protein [Pedobacter caeni]|nr:hypothetical protein [Pedobacter caeni]